MHTYRVGKCHVTMETFTAGFQPVSLLPPSLADYMSWSHTLPTRGKHSKQFSDAQKDVNSSTTTTTATIEDKPQSAPVPVTLRRTNINATNTRFIPRAVMNYATASPVHTRPDAETDGRKPEASTMQANTLGNSLNGAAAVTTSYSSSSKLLSTSSEHLAVGYRGRTPGEIVTSAMLKRRSSGGLKKAIGLYHENRKQFVVNEGRRTTLADVKSDFPVVDDGADVAPDRTLLVDGDVLDRVSISAGQLLVFIVVNGYSNMYISVR